MTAVVSRYRTRGAVREVGKALGLPEDMTAALSGQVWGWSNEGVAERHVEELSLDRNDPRLALTLELARQLIGTPRHLSASIRAASSSPTTGSTTSSRSSRRRWRTAASSNGTRTISRHLSFMKVDVLGLGMLGCMRRAFDLLREHRAALTLDFADLQEDDPAVFAMIREGRHARRLPDREPGADVDAAADEADATFYDLVIQVAIVRPGPIQGDMVHPYLRRREGKEKPEYPQPELRRGAREDAWACRSSRSRR